MTRSGPHLIGVALLLGAGCVHDDAPCTGHWGLEFGMTREQAVAALCLQGDDAPVVRRVGAHGTEVVTLTRSRATAGPREIVAEVHEGRVMVIRATLRDGDPRAAGPQVEVNPLFIVGRRRLPQGGWDYRNIARDCSARAGELRLLEAEWRAQRTVQATPAR
ncbi:MAG: hypothetical protein SFW67_08250 [Myxococcaceae bacterium]|nr:hypothetical protein [Myxococcaceae bacterium]